MAGVVVVGGANVDIKGRASSRVVAGTSNPGEVTVSAGGVGRNIAENLARLGVEVALISCVGDDANGQMIRHATAQAGVDVTMLETGEAPSGTYLAILGDTGEMLIAVNDMRVVDSISRQLLERHATRIAEAELLVADCNIPLDCLTWVCDFSKRNGLRLVIDPISIPKARKLLSLGPELRVFAIAANRLQAEELSGVASIDEAVTRIHRLGFANVIVHLGRDGVIVSNGNSNVLRLPCLIVEDIADVTGAGDAAVAGLICGLLSGLDLFTSAQLGQAAAALKLQSRNSVTDEMSRDKVFALAGLSQEIE